MVLVGRPNVGKSTLFNALTRSRQALVADVPGLTRDRQYGEGRVGGRPYLVVDTGGLVDEQDRMTSLVMTQTRMALAEADAIVLLVDGRCGPLPHDYTIAEQLRSLGRPVVIAVNRPRVWSRIWRSLSFMPSVLASRARSLRPTTKVLKR